MPSPSFTVPGMSVKDASQVIDHLQDRLVALIDLQLALEHVHREEALTAGRSGS